jgi:hypothetical protein
VVAAAPSLTHVNGWGVPASLYILGVVSRIQFY